ncbi:hypothetical protein HY642_05460, partial [Candidatus Woesearchaeota archaeon]|nr:hypothetical protein [Candidatus Woesearchaeota archaeon]
AVVILSLVAIGYKSNKAPNIAGHSADEIEMANGRTVEQAYAALSAQAEPPVSCIVLADNPSSSRAIGVAVPAACSDPNKGCYLVVRGRQSSGLGIMTSIVPYIQSASGRPYYLVSATPTKASNAALPSPLPVGDLASLAALRQFLHIAESTDPNAFPASGMIVDGYATAALSVSGGQFIVGLSTKVWVCS